MDHLCEEYFPVLDELYEDGINNRKEGPHTFRSLVENLVGDSDINDTEACRVVDAWWTNKNKLKPGNEQISEAIKHDILTRLNDGSHHYNKADIDMDMIYNDPRDWLMEAYEEALDLMFYLKAAMIRRDQDKTMIKHGFGHENRGFRSSNGVSDIDNGVSDIDNSQSKVKDSKVNKNKGEESKGSLSEIKHGSPRLKTLDY